jgi:hypothetical protein
MERSNRVVPCEPGRRDGRRQSHSDAEDTPARARRTNGFSRERGTRSAKGVAVVRDPLQIEDNQNLAHVWREIDADDANRLRYGLRGFPSWENPALDHAAIKSGSS